MIRSMPVLQVTDVAASEASYCDKRGLTSYGTWGDGLAFAIVQRGKVSIALDYSRSDDPVPVNQCWAAYIYVEDADASCEAYRDASVEIVRGPEEMVYGLRNFDIRPLDGHIIAFGHDFDLDSAEPGLMERRTVSGRR